MKNKPLGSTTLTKTRTNHPFCYLFFHMLTGLKKSILHQNCSTKSCKNNQTKFWKNPGGHVLKNFKYFLTMKS